VGERQSLLEVIIREMRSAAEEEAERILKEAELEAQKIIEEARSRAEALRSEKIKQLVFECKQKLLSELAPKRLELKGRYLQDKYRLVASQVEELISEVVNELTKTREARVAFLAHMLQRGVASMSSKELVVYPCLGSKDIISSVIEQVKQRLSPEKPNLRIEIASPIDCKEGAVIMSADGREIYNAALEAKILELKELALPKILELISLEK